MHSHHRIHRPIPKPGLLILVVLGLMFAGIIPWWMFFVFLFFAAPMCPMISKFSHSDVDSRKRKNDADNSLDKRKNDQPTFIRTQDGEWFEVID